MVGESTRPSTGASAAAGAVAAFALPWTVTPWALSRLAKDSAAAPAGSVTRAGASARLFGSVLPSSTISGVTAAMFSPSWFLCSSGPE